MNKNGIVYSDYSRTNLKLKSRFGSEPPKNTLNRAKTSIDSKSTTVGSGKNRKSSLNIFAAIKETNHTLPSTSRNKSSLIETQMNIEYNSDKINKHLKDKNRYNKNNIGLEKKNFKEHSNDEKSEGHRLNVKYSNFINNLGNQNKNLSMV
jgi:hypothetical protein